MGFMVFVVLSALSVGAKRLAWRERFAVNAGGLLRRMVQKLFRGQRVTARPIDLYDRDDGVRLFGELNSRRGRGVKFRGSF